MALWLWDSPRRSREDCSIRSTGRCESQLLLGSRDSRVGVGDTVFPSPRCGHSLPRAARRKPAFWSPGGDHVELEREVGME